MDMNLSTLWEIVEDRGAWCAAVNWVAMIFTWLSIYRTTVKKVVSGYFVTDFWFDSWVR